MTELYIDGTAVVLPQDFSIQVKRENPLFTKNGEYTYDITLQLSNPTNATLYSHLNRLNTTGWPTEKRKAILIADNRVYCNGTEVITAWTDDTVSIQIASGNSELNYIIGNDLQLSFLDMKESSTQPDTAHAEKRYPEIDYCLTPVVNRTNEHFINHWTLKPVYENGSLIRRDLAASDEYWAPQPFLCAYIRELMTALNYELLENQLENTVYKDLYICHAVETGKWNEMLPGWSVGDFLEQIEKMFNASFVVDNRKRTVRLLLNNNYYTGSQTIHVQQVTDIYEAETEEAETDDHARSTIRYNTPDNVYWRYACIPESVHGKVRHEDIPADFEPDKGEIARINLWFDEQERRRYDTIYTDVLYGGEYLPKSSYDWYVVDQFKPLKRDEAENEIELDIMPVELAQTNIQEAFEIIEPAFISLFLPVVDGEAGDGEESEEEGTSVKELLDADTTDESSDSGNGKIFLAFFYGRELMMYYGESSAAHNKYPLPFTDIYMQEQVTSFLYQLKTNDNNATLRLASLDELFYQGAYDIDYEKAIKLTSYDPNIYPANQIFEIRNRRYVCKEMEYALDAHGRKGAWTGTFYPIRISDTEADARWILTDGKWRDGGVWLDNGRWLDE